MGDEDGSTFVVKQNDNFYIYRINGWMYRNRKMVDEDPITLEDTLKQFPKWSEAWKNSSDKNTQGKYKYVYMGFGNGLSVDNSIYTKFEPYLNNCVEEYLKDKTEEERKSLKYAAIFNSWKKALKKMIENTNK